MEVKIVVREQVTTTGAKAIFFLEKTAFLTPFGRHFERFLNN